MIPAHDVYDARDVAEHRVAAVLGYVWILWLVPVVFKRGSAFALFHGRQGLLLFIVESLGMLVSWIPGLNILFFLGCIVLAVIGISNALNGQAKPLPIIGRYTNFLD